MSSLQRPASLDTAPDPRQNSASRSDSINVLLFTGFTVQEAQVSSNDALVIRDMHAPRQRTVRIRARGDSVRIGGTVRSSILFTVKRGELWLAIEGRRRLVRGTLTCTARNGRLQMVGRMAVRDYLASTLSTEAASNDPMEYLVALAVLQRNYMQFHRERHAPAADLCDNTHCQRSDAGNTTPRIYTAVDRAVKLVLDAGDGLPCYYSVNCGGSTLTPAQIWNHPEPGYASVHCTHCRNSARFRWTRRFPATPEAVAVVRNAPQLPFVNDDFKIRLGRVVGFNNVLSNTIDRIERRGAIYLMAGRGFGHRVGMCQEGAARLARNGWDADAILRFYFPTARVTLRR